jgi:putative hemolysin
MDADADSFFIIISLWANPMLEISLNLILLLILLAISGLISAAEMAFFSLQHDDVLILQNTKDKKSILVLSLLQKANYLLSALLVGNTIVNISIVLVLGWLLNNCFNSVYLPFIQFLIAWFLIICIGEISPKLYGGQQPLRIALWSVNFVRSLLFFCAPANFLLVNFTNLIEKRLKNRIVKPNNKEISQKDIEQVIDITMKQSPYATREAKMIKSLVKFSNKTARSAMHARMEIVAVEKNDSFAQIILTFKQSAFSRIPVYDSDLDKIIGILHFKDVIAFLNQPKQWNLSTVLRDSYFIPENKKLDDLLADLQKEQQHLAIVIDEFGQTSGIVTLEDILEHIVGDIDDEFDEPESELYQIIDAENFIFNTLIALDSVFDLCNLDPNRFAHLRQDSETLAGLIIILHQQMPTVGDIIIFEELHFTILEANERQILSVRLSLFNNHLLSAPIYE